MIGTKILEERKSTYNGELRVVKTLGMGIYIQSNGLTQSGGIVEGIWKQTLRKFNKKPINKILVLGFGGGTVAKLIQKKWPDTKITGVEIDPLMINLGEKYLGLNKTNIGITVGDALEFIKKDKTKYDLIIIDLYNGDEFPKQFETDDFIHLVKSHLSKSGTVIFNRLYYGDKRSEAVKFGNRLKSLFKDVDWFYPEANLMFLCSKEV